VTSSQDAQDVELLGCDVFRVEYRFCLFFQPADGEQQIHDRLLVFVSKFGLLYVLLE
jgi:hypothetical protein